MEIGPYEDDDAGISYHAMKGDVQLIADNPLELLGLASIADNTQIKDQPYWWVRRGENLYDQLLQHALRVGFWELLSRDPARWKEEVHQAQQRVNETALLHEALGIPERDTPKVMAMMAQLESDPE